jgi:sugar lactone lactonase YvrE
MTRLLLPMRNFFLIAVCALSVVAQAQVYDTKIEKPLATGQFKYPYGMAETNPADGDFLWAAADTRVLKFNKATGAIVAELTTGISGEMLFAHAVDVAIHPTNGDIYVSETAANRIQHFGKNGNYIGSWGGTGSAAGQFRSPFGIAVDANGFVYVADADNNRIQKFNGTTPYAQLAAIGSFGTADGQFQAPFGIDVDNAGNIYVCELVGYRVQKFNSSLAFVTKWGSSGTGQQNFNLPWALALSGNGSMVYVVDASNSKIKIWSSAGSFIAEVGSNGFTNGSFTFPLGIEVDATTGDFYVSDNFRIQKFNSANSWQSTWTDPPDDNGQFSYPTKLATDASGNVYVIDNQNFRIQKFDKYGAFLAKAGTRVASPAVGQFVGSPVGIALGANGDVYVASDFRVQRFSSSLATAVEIFTATSGTGANQISYMSDLAIDPVTGDLLIVDTGNHRIKRHTAGGTPISSFGTFGTGDLQFSNPSAVAVDAQGNIYVADNGNNRIQKINSNGTFATKWGNSGTGDGQFSAPNDITFDTQGNVLVADVGNQRIQRFTNTGTFIDKFGEVGTENGQFRSPNGIAIDANDGSVYVGDSNNDRVQKFLYTDKVQPTNLVFSNVTPTSLTVSFTASAVPRDGYIAFMSTNDPRDIDPEDGTTYTVGQTIPGSSNTKVVYKGSATSFNVSGLTANQAYYVHIFSYSDPGDGTILNYCASEPLSSYIITPDVSPTNPGLFHVFSKGLEWAYVTDSYVDANDNNSYYIVGGYFPQSNGVNDFNPDPNVVYTLPNNNQDINTFIAKYSNTGAFVWAQGIGGPGVDLPKDIKVVGTNVYVVGRFDGATIDLNPDVSTAFTLTSAGGSDGFVVRLNATTGNFISGFGVSGTGYDAINGVDSNGTNVYITGQKSGNLYFAGLTAASPTPSAVFTKEIPGGEGQEVILDGTTINVIGGVWQSGSFDYPATAATYTTAGFGDIFVARYNTSSGSFAGVGRVYGGTEEDYVEDAKLITVAVGDKRILLTGSFSETINFGSGISITSKGQQDAYLVQVAYTDLVPKLGTAIGGPGADVGRGLALTLNSDILLTGDFMYVADFDPGSGYANKAATDIDCFLLKLQKDFTFSKVISIGTADDFAGDQGYGVAVNSTDEIFLAANFGSFGTVDVDPTTEVSLFPTSSGFVKYTENVTLATEPTAQPTNLSFSQSSGSAFGLSFSAAASAPAGYLILMAENATPNTAPVDGIPYASGTLYGNAVSVSAGTSTTFNVTNANSTKAYYFRIYSYNGGGGTINYNTTNPLLGYFTLEPTIQTTNVAIESRTNISVKYNLTPGNGQWQLVVFKETTDVDAIPQDFGGPYNGADYNYGTGTQLGTGNYVIAVGPGLTTFTTGGLKAATRYSIAIFDFNDSGTTGLLSPTSARANYLATIGTNRVSFYTLANEPASNPADFTSSTSAGTITLNFSAANSGNNADGYVILKTTGSTAPAVTGIVDGVDATGFSLPSGTTVLNDITNASTTSYVDSGLTPGTTYRYLIVPYKIGNNAATTRNYKIDGTLKTTFGTIPTDNTAPVLESNLTQSAVAVGTQVNVVAKFTDGESTVSGVKLLYRNITAGGSFSAPVTMTLVSSNWAGTIPATVTTGELGVEYKMEATSAGGTLTTPLYQVKITPIASGLTIPYTSFGDKVTNYRIFSVPLTLDSKSVGAVFNELGTADPKKWRVARYQNGATTQSYAGDIEPGKGYWLIIKQDAGVINSGTGSIVDANADVPFSIDLVQGWNQIGNPYNFDISWSDIKNLAANSALNLPNTFRQYRDGTFKDGSDKISKMEGVFINKTTSGTAKLYFPVVKTLAGRKAKDEYLDNPIDNRNWEVYLNAEQGELKTFISGVGMNDQASLENDVYDGFAMPRFTDYLELNHPKSFNGFAYSKDIVPTAESFVWDFSVETSITDDPIITIYWDNSYFGENEKQLFLWDVNQQLAIDMRVHSKYQFNRNASGNFKVIFGNEEFLREITQVNALVFHHIIPNPVRDEAVIGFSLPRTEQVAIELIDMTGRKADVVFEGTLEQGYHEVLYKRSDGKSGGVYIAQIKAGKSLAQKRMVLKN